MGAIMSGEAQLARKTAAKKNRRINKGAAR
jgi:hypothetical protein